MRDVIQAEQDMAMEESQNKREYAESMITEYKAGRKVRANVESSAQKAMAEERRAISSVFAGPQGFGGDMRRLGGMSSGFAGPRKFGKGARKLGEGLGGFRSKSRDVAGEAESFITRTGAQGGVWNMPDEEKKLWQQAQGQAGSGNLNASSETFKKLSTMASGEQKVMSAQQRLADLTGFVGEGQDKQVKVIIDTSDWVKVIIEGNNQVVEEIKRGAG